MIEPTAEGARGPGLVESVPGFPCALVLIAPREVAHIKGIQVSPGH